MSSSKIEILVLETLDDFYLQRLIKLSEVKLRDLLRKKNPYLLCATNGHSVPKLVEKMLEEYLSQSDESIFGDAFFESIARIESEGTLSPGKKSNTIYKAIAFIDLIRDHPTQNRLEFMDAQSKALNRLEQEFLINFGNPDGSINWEKVLRYNREKEKFTG